MNLTAIRPQETSRQAELLYKSFADIPIYDQRYFPRWSTHHKAYYRKSGEQVPVVTQLRDLTLSGVSLYANGSIQVNDSLEMKIYLSCEVSFRVEGIVLWKKTHTIQPYVGIIFNNVSEDIQAAILKYSFAFQA